ncbi:ribonuclease PH [Paenibacillus anaericanus]|uniref:YqzE family protein n=1 Tax=Paenibacillus anaericanus TaxID=170367 RepID=UPI00278832E4|nr:YqzE family protein [Paenibacillus anaericanus]MDQ0086694.1 ribonuclease PH [Paenibacillus anaericanus]
MAKGDELVKYITERVVDYVETPREIRREQRSKTKEPWANLWFGMIPFSITLWLKRFPTRRKRDKQDSSRHL